MNLDQLKNQWAACDLKLDQTLRLNAQLLRDTRMTKVDRVLRRHSRGLVAELLMNVAAVVLIGSFVAEHVAEPRFLLPALVLHMFVVLQLFFGVRQMVALGAVDYAAPILAIQKKLETLRVQRIGLTRWTLIVSPLLWTPLLIVALEGVWGVDAYAAFDGGFLLVNLVTGAALIPLLYWASKHMAGRLRGAPWFERLMDDVAGRSLSSARAFLDELSRFEQEQAG